MDAIECDSLVVRYGSVTAVDGVSFTTARGSLFGLLGPNAAGKSTTMSVLSTLRAPSSGTVRVAGHDVARDPAAVRRCIGVQFQDGSLDDRLTGRENLALHATVYGVARSERASRIDEAISLTGLGDAIDRQVRTYSGGMKRRLELARALLHRPQVLFLDEPTAGLDPQTRRHLWSKLDELRGERGVTVFLTTHSMEEAERADHVAILDRGKIVAIGTPDELRALVPESEIARPPPKTGATLEDVFVHLTGHAMREESAGATDLAQSAMARRKGRV